MMHYKSEGFDGYKIEMPGGEVNSNLVPDLEEIREVPKTRDDLKEVIKRSWPQRGWAPNADKIGKA